MAKTVDVAGGEIITSAWGNEVRDRTRQVFATLAELTSGWPTAPVGAHAWLTNSQIPMVKTAAGWSAERQAWVDVVSTGATGAATVTYPAPFTAPPVITAIDGDASDTGCRQFGVVRANHTATSTRFVAFSATGVLAANALVRIEWTAVLAPAPT